MEGNVNGGLLLATGSWQLVGSQPLKASYFLSANVNTNP